MLAAHYTWFSEAQSSQLILGSRGILSQHYYLLDTLVFSFGVIGSNKDVLYPAFRHYGLNPANPLSHPEYRRQF